MILKNPLFAVDTLSQWNRNDIKTKKFQSFDLKKGIDIGYNKNNAVWCTLKIKNLDNINTQSKWICLNNNDLDSISLFDNNTIKTLGDRTRNISPFIEAQAFEVTLKPNQEKVLLFRIKKIVSFAKFNFYLEDESALIQKSNHKIALLSFSLGIVFLVILFNFHLYYFSRDKIYLCYNLYATVTIIYLMISTHFAKNIFFNNFLYFSELRIYSAAIWMIVLTLFVTTFLGVKQTQSKKYNIIILLNTINLILISITVFLLLINKNEWLKPFFYIGYINFTIIFFFILMNASQNLKNNRNSAIYVLAAFIPHIVWGTVNIFSSFKIIGYSTPHNSLIYICFYEILMFGYILTQNYISTFQRNNELNREIILEKEKTLQTITNTQIRERRNISNIIHDNFGSKIAHILQLIQLKNNDLAKNNIEKLASDIREISHTILPKSLDEGALISSLESQIPSWNLNLKNTSIEIFSYDFPEKIQEKWIFDMYLISLEIINNALRHGQPTSVIIELYAYSKHYLFQFTDDGKGFDPQVIAKGFGLENIEKRVLFYKGTLDINSSKNNGTILQICIPKI
ncbi:sensor histidine kinase [Flavobacterium taihuense]|uniref:histidine kinase n=1 Tax=Flavobacterium taihuense TaxID=2857508 RepID=A0ABS6Y1C9_9FLAO|nr:7TM diverse intracellular signaling domain-containing protein [Flavobacterium taihuense]MBW4362738.1 hypothetical protein [Flavobacterium taihuense]